MALFVDVADVGPFDAATVDVNGCSSSLLESCIGKARAPGHRHTHAYFPALRCLTLVNLPIVENKLAHTLSSSLESLVGGK